MKYEFKEGDKVRLSGEWANCSSSELTGAVEYIDDKRIKVDINYRGVTMPLFLDKYGIADDGLLAIEKIEDKRKFDPSKKYGLRNGCEYVNYSCDNGGTYPIHGKYYEPCNKIWIAIEHTNDLFNHENRFGSDRDLVEINPYADFKIDDKVLVWDRDGERKKPRYFAGVDAEGNPTTFAGGRTSYTCDDFDQENVSWDHCEKAES